MLKSTQCHHLKYKKNSEEEKDKIEEQEGGFKGFVSFYVLGIIFYQVQKMYS